MARRLPGYECVRGPSVHWNTAVQQYVMLLNRTQDDTFAQEGIYVSFAPSLDDPTRWSIPQRLLAGGRWYPQVIGLEIGEGTDKLAGGVARFFIGGALYASDPLRHSMKPRF